MRRTGASSRSRTTFRLPGEEGEDEENEEELLSCVRNVSVKMIKM